MNASRCAMTDGSLLLVMGDPFDAGLQGWAEQRIPCLLLGPGPSADVAAYLARYEETLHAMDSLLPVGDELSAGGERVEDLSFKTISEDTSPVVKLVHSTLYDALKTAASDIHLETGPTGLVIKYRIDGVLTTVGSMAGLELAEQVISRIKVMSELDIAERRVPQDGRFKVTVRGREVDFRVSIMPSIFGEDAVLRILDKQALSDQIKGLRLSYLGFDDEAIASTAPPFQRALRHGAGDRPDRQRQDHHPVCGDHRDQPWPGQDHHHRGSGRVPVAGRAANSGEREERADLRARPAFDPAPRPGQDHGGRDPRSRKPRRSRCSRR